MQFTTATLAALSAAFFSTAAASPVGTSLKSLRDDSTCDAMAHESPDENSPNLRYWNYCEHVSDTIVNDAQKVSDDLKCPTGGPNCTIATNTQYTVMQSFSINVGLSADAAAGDFKSTASVGASWSWSTSTATGTTYTLPIQAGQTGHLLFWPYIHRSCGEYIYYEEQCGPDGCEVPDAPTGDDPNACGYTPVLQDGEGRPAAGEFTVCITAGPQSADDGCVKPPPPP